LEAFIDLVKYEDVKRLQVQSSLFKVKPLNLF